MNILQSLNGTDALYALGMGAVVLVLMLLCMPALIRYLHRLKFGQTEREEGLESHKKKSGTPTMGGLAFLFIPFVVYALFSLFSPFGWNASTLILWGAYLGFGLIGFWDDYLIVVRKDNTGLKPWLKFGLQSILAVALTVLYLLNNGAAAIGVAPFGAVSIPVVLFFVIVFFMFTGSTNAVNLSDGVDGLCAGLSAIAYIPFVCLLIWQGKADSAAILFMVIAALIGYLRFNIHPARVFMGDTGSLALGGLLAAAALISQGELVLLLAGMVFIAEAVSDIIQVAHYKRTKRRVFLMAPLHHHFEKAGWTEMKVCVIFWSWGALFALLALWLAAMM